MDMKIQPRFTGRNLTTKEVNHIIKNNLTHPYYKKLPIKQENILQKVFNSIKSFVGKFIRIEIVD